ncbi:MAG: hypothetical protein WAK95_20315 [Desulfobacterales bacterium]
MATEFRPEVLGVRDMKGKPVDPEAAIEKMENELKEMARSLRQIRRDYVSGMISDDEFGKAESKFMEKLAEQRNVLQLLRSAAGRNK